MKYSPGYMGTAPCGLGRLAEVCALREKERRKLGQETLKGRVPVWSAGN